MREDEEVCRRCFDRYLTDRLRLGPTEWRVGENPPDYDLVIADREFAVEVTSLVGKHDVDPEPISEIGYVASMRGLTQEIESEATEQGILRGTYVIAFPGPFDRFGKVRNLLKSRALDYIGETQDLSEEPGCHILKEGRKTCYIMKVHNNLDKVHPGVFSPLKFESETLSEARDLLRQALSRKKEILQKRETQNGITLPNKTLLLRHRYPIADSKIYKRCARSAEAAELMDWFHTIFVVENVTEGYFLHTQEESWAAEFRQRFHA